MNFINLDSTFEYDDFHNCKSEILINPLVKRQPGLNWKVQNDSFEKKKENAGNQIFHYMGKFSKNQKTHHKWWVYLGLFVVYNLLNKLCCSFFISRI